MDESDHNESSNIGRYLILAVLLVIVLGVAYARSPEIREFAEAKAPWFKANVGRYLVAPVAGSGQEAVDGEAPAAIGANATQGFDLENFAAHPESWPKSVAIKVATQFPAVVNSKVVGNVVAPAGSEVRLLKVEKGKLGVEFQGGGAWVSPEATDLTQRVQAGLGSPP